MHNVNMIHRDLKLANILLHIPTLNLLAMSKEERTLLISQLNLRETVFEIKISDFGFAKRFDSRSRMKN